jgi:hypothetical protein
VGLRVSSENSFHESIAKKKKMKMFHNNTDRKWSVHKLMLEEQFLLTMNSENDIVNTAYDKGRSARAGQGWTQR